MTLKQGSPGTGWVMRHHRVNMLPGLFFKLYKGVKRMDIAAISQLIGSLGFPIVACGALFWMCNTTLKANTDAINSVTDAVTANTHATAELSQLVQLLAGQIQQGGDNAA